ncbi:MAG: thioredoxin family protein [Candidatus Cloacimonetes bacterium]|nr:thioredoxin family protein [Candidatus Cloacimonadota bacterium]
MKLYIILLTILTLFIFPSCMAEKPEINTSQNQLYWYSNIEEAISNASTDNKAILINFTGSDWCGWCVRLKDEVFSQEDFSTFAQENLILVKLDYPRNIAQSDETKLYNNQMMAKYQVKGFPTIVLLDSKGKEIGRTGYKPGGPAVYVTHLQSIIEGR